MIDAVVVAVLAFTVWAIDHLHLPLDAVHTLAAQTVTAFAFIVATTEAARARGRHTGAQHRAGGERS